MFHVVSSLFPIPLLFCPLYENIQHNNSKLYKRRKTLYVEIQIDSLYILILLSTFVEE